MLGERKRQISGQMVGRPVVRERLRSVWLGGTENRVVLDTAADTLPGRLTEALRIEHKGGRSAASSTALSASPLCAPRSRCFRRWRFAIKKWAALAALAAATFYLVLSGAEVATQRSYIMMG